MGVPKTICRDCGWLGSPSAQLCPECGGGRFYQHDELIRLGIAHVDCDAFYASIEKRDNPGIAGKPVIVGGGRRGVVAACCYVARISGVRSAMPMFKALKNCPNAVVIRPNMEKYRRVGLEIRKLMQELTPLVEPISIDEAFLDLSGTETLHRAPPAVTLVRMVRRIEREIGVTASIGLSYNKFLAKVASDLDKPRGFAAIGRGEVLDFLGPKPVRMIWGVGASLARRLERDGIATIADLRRLSETDLMARHGVMGRRLYTFARGEDDRPVTPGGAAKSVSAETTFDTDLHTLADLKPVLWRLSEKVSARLKAKELGGGTVVLKLKTADFRQFTRSRRLDAPTRSAETIYQAGLPLLEREIGHRRFRLLGVGVQSIAAWRGGARDGATADLLAADPGRKEKIEDVMDALRARFGDDAVKKGRSMKTD